jgi:hypothetical protein
MMSMGFKILVRIILAIIEIIRIDFKEFEWSD